MNAPDPFPGTWIFIPAKSKMNGPSVQHWVQYIDVSDRVIRVREDLTAGRHASVSLEAKLDGKDYSVAGSSLADTIAYQRTDSHHLAGVGKKNGNVALRETITVAPDNSTMTLNFAIFSGEKEVTNGVAFFERTAR